MEFAWCIASTGQRRAGLAPCFEVDVRLLAEAGRNPVLLHAGHANGHDLAEFIQGADVAALAHVDPLGIVKKLPHDGQPGADLMGMFVQGSPLLVLVVTLLFDGEKHVFSGQSCHFNILCALQQLRSHSTRKSG